MSQLVKTKRQANFKDFKRLGAFKGFVEQKNIVFNSFVCKLAHSCQKKPNLHTNSLNKLLHIMKSYVLRLVVWLLNAVHLKLRFLRKVRRAQLTVSCALRTTA
jgi:hypothetical protein